MLSQSMKVSYQEKSLEEVLADKMGHMKMESPSCRRRRVKALHSKSR
jgi:hypothetical protein